MTGRQEDMALKAVTGLEGGLAGSGSTCGVVTAGVLGIALMREHGLDEGGETAQRLVLTEARHYVDWFNERFSTTLCRERTGVDFQKIKGLLRYFLPFDPVCRCLWHTGRAASYLNTLSSDEGAVDNIGLGRSPHPGAVIPADAGSRQDQEAMIPASQAIHCATEVLRGVRESCGLADDTLEKISFVMDGGVALSGGLCGAVAGAVMALNLTFGWDIRTMSYLSTIREFIVGHKNLLVEKPIGRPKTFAIGKAMVRQLKGDLEGLECVNITAKKFAGWDEFQAHIHSSELCNDLIARAASTAVDAITRWRTL